MPKHSGMIDFMSYQFDETLDYLPLIKNPPNYWPIDNVSWTAPSIKITKDSWLVNWSKTESRTQTDKFEFAQLKYPLKPKSPIVVKHASFGEGIAHSSNNDSVIVDFKSGQKEVHWSALHKQEPVYEKTKLTTPIKRIILIHLSSKIGRLISADEQNGEFKIQADNKGDKTTLDELIKVLAIHDDMLPLLKTAAKWRQNQASEKQKALIKAKIPDYPDIDTLTSGDASSIIDQIFWRKTILNIFSGNS